MKKIILIFGIIIFLLIGIFYQLKENTVTDNVVPEQVDSSYQFPTSTVQYVDTSSSETITLKTSGGNTVSAKNFLRNDDVRADAQNSGYVFLGNVFPAVEGETLPSYVITYIRETQFFNVTLLREPLNISRYEAETYLQDTLGLSESEMCTLQYTLSVPNYVNAVYSGMDLRFSFCPSSVTLE